MAIKLVLSNTSEPIDTEEYTFEQQRISIGREKGSDLHIPDTSRVVSKKHAEISCANDVYEIADLGSKNFTYLNDTRLESGRAYLLNNGDVIRLGEYEVEFVILTPEPEPEPEPEPVVVQDSDKTLFESSYVNPFEEDVTALMGALHRICEVFDGESPNRRADALKEALISLNFEQTHEACDLVVSVLKPNGEIIDGDATDPIVHGVSLNERNGENVGGVPDNRALAPIARTEPVVLSDKMDQVMDVVFNVLSMLVSIPWEFRHEFVGHTIAQTPESAILYEGNAAKLREFLFDPELDDEELARRLVLIEEGGDEVILHQLAMLDGYKAVVQQGMHMLLREIDPIVAAENLSQSTWIYRSLPRLSRLVASWGLQEKFKELRAEDWSITERRAYRPSFIRAYLSRMSSGPQKVPDAN